MLDELARTVEAARERFRVPGVSFGVLADGGTETAAFGVTSVEHPLDVTPDTLFQAGSITKTVTGTLALRLELDLDAPVRDRLPRLRLADESVAERVTLRHLLTHTGGWSGDYFDSGDWGDEALARMVDRLDTLPQLTPLGETFSYNNAGFYIAGRLLETVGDATYEELVRMHVLEPMGLDHSFFFPDEVMTHRFAVGHDVEGAVARPWPVGRPAHPAGGLVTTVGDLLRFARTHIEDESLRSMQEPQVAIGAEYEAVGLTWFLDTIDGSRTLAHGGGTNGQQSLLWVAPDDRKAVAILTNGARGSRVAREALRSAQRLYLGVEVDEPEPIPLTRERLAEYAGVWSARHQDLELAVVDGDLVASVRPKGGFPTPDAPPPPPPPPFRVGFYREDKAVALDGPYAGTRSMFLRSTSGELEWLRAGLRLHARG